MNVFAASDFQRNYTIRTKTNSEVNSLKSVTDDAKRTNAQLASIEYKMCCQNGTGRLCFGTNLTIPDPD